MRKVIIILLTCFLVLLTTGIAHAAPQIVLDGKALTFQDAQPTIETGRTLVPLRAVLEALGAEVQWDGAANTVKATRGTTEIKLFIGGQAYKNGQPVELDVPARIIDGRTMVPLRFVSEALDYFVNWDEKRQIITIVPPNITMQVISPSLMQ